MGRAAEVAERPVGRVILMREHGPMNRCERRRKCKLFSLVMGTLLVTVLPASFSAEELNDIVIIANKSFEADSIDAEELRAIFLKKKGTFMGRKVTPINAKSGSGIRIEFQKKFLRMSPTDEKHYWEKRKVKDGVTAPPEFSRSQRAVFKLESAIGYCARSKYHEGPTKVLKVKF